MILDRTDHRILAALTADGRASVESVAEAVSLSPTPVRRRIRAMEEAGVIRGYMASIDPEKCGFETLLYVFIKLKSRDRETIADFEERVRVQPEIQKCDLITGAHDYVLMVRMAGMKAYDSYLREKLAELPGVFGIETSVVIGPVKDVSFLPPQQ
jgi:Lrp/AsnC family transcriptional regulator, leucine-responsive regulatory protein